MQEDWILRNDCFAYNDRVVLISILTCPKIKPIIEYCNELEILFTNNM